MSMESKFMFFFILHLKILLKIIICCVYNSCKPKNIMYNILLSLNVLYNAVDKLLVVTGKSVSLYSFLKDSPIKTFNTLRIYFIR